MNLSEFQKKYGIKRIDFGKVKPSEHETEYDTDRLICPYCGEVIEYGDEEIDDILRGESYQCPECEKRFYASGEVSIDTTCTPMEDAVLENQNHIEGMYHYMDECDKKGCQWDGRYGVVEWETYKEFAEPLFENMRIDAEAQNGKNT